MSSASNTTVLITGARIGIGGGLVKEYLARPSTTVVAAVRDTSSPTLQTLKSLPKGAGSSLILVKISSESDTDAKNAVQQLTTEHGIKALDIVIANAGIFNIAAMQPLATVDLAEVKAHNEVNVTGVLRLFQATLPLLSKSANPRFIAVSSAAGSIASDFAVMPIGVYGGSKAHINFLTKRIALENPNLIAIALHPGAVATPGADTMEPIFEKYGVKKVMPFISIEESTTGIVKVVDNATKETASGKFLSYDGSEVPW